MKLFGYKSSLITHYGIEINSIASLALGADINAFIYKVVTPQQQAYFIKLKAGYHHEVGVEVVELLEKAGVQQLIPPVKTIHGSSTQRIEAFTLIVYPFVEGQDGFNRTLTDDQWVLLGKTLRQVHEVKVLQPLQHQLRREAYSAKWREMIRSLYVEIEGVSTVDEIASDLQLFMKKNKQVIDRLVDRAEALGEKLKKQSP